MMIRWCVNHSVILENWFQRRYIPRKWKFFCFHLPVFHNNPILSSWGIFSELQKHQFTPLYQNSNKNEDELSFYSHLALDSWSLKWLNLWWPHFFIKLTSIQVISQRSILKFDQKRSKQNHSCLIRFQMTVIVSLEMVVKCKIFVKWLEGINTTQNFKLKNCLTCKILHCWVKWNRLDKTCNIIADYQFWWIHICFTFEIQSNANL